MKAVHEQQKPCGFWDLLCCQSKW